jgi:hypothetical protein
MTVLISMITTVMSEVTRLYDLPQVPMFKTVMSQVTRLYDLPQVPMIKTVISEVTRLYDLPQVPLMSYKRVTSDMTVLIISTWGWAYKRVT